MESLIVPSSPSWESRLTGTQAKCPNGIVITLDNTDRFNDLQVVHRGIIDSVYSTVFGRVIGYFFDRGQQWALYNNAFGRPLAVAQYKCYILESWDAVWNKGPELQSSGFFENSQYSLPALPRFDQGRFELLMQLLTNFDPLIAEKYSGDARREILPQCRGRTFMAGKTTVTVCPVHGLWPDTIHSDFPFSIESTVLAPHNPAMKHGFTFGFMKNSKGRLQAVAINSYGNILAYTPTSVTMVAVSFKDFLTYGPTNQLNAKVKGPKPETDGEFVPAGIPDAEPLDELMWGQRRSSVGQSEDPPISPFVNLTELDVSSVLMPDEETLCCYLNDFEEVKNAS